MADPLLAVAIWYHGLLPREDIRSFLRENGDFLVRMTEPSAPGKREFVLSVMWDKAKEANGVKHFVIQRNLNKYSIEKTAQFDTINELVKHFQTSGESISSLTTVPLKTPVVRRSWQLDHTDVELTKKLGEGAFGEVWMGILRMKKTGKKVKVAIKLAKLDVMTKEQLKEIMREARLMRFLDHPNIVKLLGVAAGSEPLMIVMELASNGALDSYLQKNAVSKEKKAEMCLQAAWGLEYLHDRNVIHRDIASRNCLYGDGNVKISDFGLSRTGLTYQMNPKNRVPIRWLAPETLRTAAYSPSTDVWAYGIMSWEIFHNGQEPYPGMTVAEMNNRVREGYRMNFNDVQVHPDIVKLIEQRCWAENALERFAMGDIAKSLELITGIKRPSSKEASEEKTREGSKSGTRSKSIGAFGGKGKRKLGSSLNNVKSISANK